MTEHLLDHISIHEETGNGDVALSPIPKSQSENPSLVIEASSAHLDIENNIVVSLPPKTRRTIQVNVIARRKAELRVVIDSLDVIHS